jgi:hypothetical protein
MKNWRDYVGYQPLDQYEAPKGYYVLTAVKPNADGSPSGSFTIIREPIDVSEITLTEDQVGQAVEDVMKSFPKKDIITNIDLEQAKVQVAEDTRRAFATTNFGRAWYYHGGSFTDSAIYVIEYRGKYAVKKHPDFDKYGFCA